MLFVLLASLVLGHSNSQRLKKLNAYKTPVIPLTSKTFDMFTEYPRDYTIYIQLTTKAKEHNCAACFEFGPEFELVASSGNLASKKIYFGELNYQGNEVTFQKLKVDNVPIVIKYSPKQEGFEVYDLFPNGKTAEKFAAYVNAGSSVSIKIKRPFNYTPYLYPAIAAISFFGSLFILRDSIVMLISGQNVWMLGTMVFTSIMTSGYMWTKIRNPPFIAMRRDLTAEFVAPGFQNQHGVETFITTAFYMVISSAIIMLANVKYLQSRTRFSAFIIAMGVFLFVYSAMFSYFKMKNPQYPFSILL